ncbi:MAG: S-layer homology domain-containing protein [Cyanobacteria bacterium P01_H01_bin.58]
MTIRPWINQSQRLLGITGAALLSAATISDIAQAQTTMFNDVSATHWAKDYIETLGTLEIISGFPDGTFLPDKPVTRAQFATIVNKAFLSASSSGVSPEASQSFADVAADHWAVDAINATRISAFLSGYPGNIFRPEQNIPRVQALAALVNGLNYTGGSVDMLSYFQDANDIPDYAREGIAAASAKGIVVNYPTLNQLAPNREATRAEVAAIAYWAMVQNGQVNAPGSAPYRVPPQPSSWRETPIATLPTITKRIALSKNGERVVTLSEKSDRSGTENVFALQVWDVKTGELVMEKTPDAGAWFSAIAISEDGQQIAAISTMSPDYKMELLVWNLAEATAFVEPSVRQSLGTVHPQPDQPPSQAVDAFTTTQVVFRPGDNAILTQVNLGENNADNKPTERHLRLHDSATGEVLQTLTPTPGATLTQFEFSPDGSILAARGTTSAGTTSPVDSLIDLWRLDERFSTIRAEAGTDRYLVGMGFTATGAFRTLEQSYVETRLNTWNLQTGEGIEQITGLGEIDRQDSLYAFSSDGVNVLVAGAVAGSRILNTHTQTTTALRIGPTGIANGMFSQDGRYLVVATFDNVQVFSNAE